MGYKLLLIGAMVVAFAGASFAGVGSSNPAINNGMHGGQNNRATVAVLETTTTSLGAALTSLGIAYDDYMGPPWNINYSQYTHIYVGMDGGLVEPTDLQPLATWANGGGFLHFYGGTCWQDYAIGMNTYIDENNTSNYCWTEVSGQPEMSIVDPTNCLAAGLPATYNWGNMAASFYQFRTTDPANMVAADNGDGYHMLFNKTMGSGRFDYCIDSSYNGYYSGQDMTILTDIVANMYNCIPPVPVQQTTWGSIKSTYK